MPLFLSAQEGALRLVGGDNRHEGDVEVYHDGRWGRVCRQSWTEHDARVVCRQLGFLDALALHGDAFGGRWSSPALLTNLHCRGNEDSVLECGHTLGPTTCQSCADVLCDPRPVAKCESLRSAVGCGLAVHFIRQSGACIHPVLQRAPN